MKLYAPLYVQRSGSKLPHAAVKLLGLEASRDHRMQEVRPRNFSRCRSEGGRVKEGTKDFESAGVELENRMDVWLVAG